MGVDIETLGVSEKKQAAQRFLAHNFDAIPHIYNDNCALAASLVSLMGYRIRASVSGCEPSGIQTVGLSSLLCFWWFGTPQLLE